MKPVKQKAWTAKRRAEFEAELKALMRKYGVCSIVTYAAGEIDGYDTNGVGLFTAASIGTDRARQTADLEKWRA